MLWGKGQISVLFVMILIFSIFSIFPPPNASRDLSNPTSLKNHSTIFINGDSQFTSSNGVVAGGGTYGNPYMIENWSIDASKEHGIRIENTNAYFIIRNCYIYNGTNGSSSEYGIYLRQVKHGIIMNNRINSNYYGIYSYYSDSNTISNNTLISNEYSLYFYRSNSNTIIDNICNSNIYYALYFYHSDTNTIENCTCNSNYYGIYLRYCESNTISSNNCNSNNNDGIYLNGESNTVTYNTCNQNRYNGISIRDEYNTVMNNYCTLNSYSGIFVYSDYNTIMNNNCTSNSYYGIQQYYSSSNILSNNECYSNNYYGIYLQDLDNTTIDSNICLNNTDSGIFLSGKTSSITLKNNKCGKNYHGINLYNCYSMGPITAMHSGTHAWYSNDDWGNQDTSLHMVFDLTSVNDANLTFWHWYQTERSSDGGRLEVDNGTGWTPIEPVGGYPGSGFWSSDYSGYCYGWVKATFKLKEYTGQKIDLRFRYAGDSSINYYGWYVDDIRIKEIGFFDDIESGPGGWTVSSTMGSKWEIASLDTHISIKGNDVTNNYYGIHLKYSNSITIENNFCTSNIIGICINDSAFTKVINNIMLSCSLHIIGYNLEFWNTHNIDLSNLVDDKPVYYWRDQTSGTIPMGAGEVILANCTNIIVQYQNLSFGSVGILLGFSDNSVINNNTCYSNNYYGLYLFNSIKNNIYHNHIITNIRQAFDDGKNFWNNSHQQGNYWSDYSGVDNGANWRIAGDGIGDTEIPHQILDYYPFTKPFGWLLPGTPILTDPGELNSDGDYPLSWNPTYRTTGYILEESQNESFNRSTVVYMGSETIFDINSQPNGTYYYRIKAYNLEYDSDWSNIVNLSVDWFPDIPHNFMVSIYPEGNALDLYWDPNLVDTIEYQLYSNHTGSWELLANIPHPLYRYNHTELNNGEHYYYRIRARDTRNQISNFSKILAAVPHDSVAPEAPGGFSADAISDREILLSWAANQEPDLEGYLVYLNDTNNTNNIPAEEFHLIHTIFGKKTSYTVSGLTEQVSYHFKIKAFDEVPNNSTFSNFASATTPDELHPIAPINLTVSNATYTNLTITWNASLEPDVVGYILFKSLSLSDPFIPVNSELINETYYIDNGLNESTIYYYKVKAVDDADLKSHFSDLAYGITLIGPHPPEINISMPDFELLEDTYDDHSINMYDWFKDINLDPLSFWYEDQKNIMVTIHQNNGTVILKPKPNWNGDQTITFYAADGIFTISDSITITVTSVNDPPENANITAPKNGIRITDGDLLDFEGTCLDVDLPYDDELTFRWSSSIVDEIGMGESLKGIYLPAGRHNITLEVTDNLGEKSSATIEISVMEASESQKNINIGQDINIVIQGILIIISVLILVLIVLRITRKKTPQVPDEKKGETQVKTTQATIEKSKNVRVNVQPPVK